MEIILSPTGSARDEKIIHIPVKSQQTTMAQLIENLVVQEVDKVNSQRTVVNDAIEQRNLTRMEEASRPKGLTSLTDSELLEMLRNDGTDRPKKGLTEPLEQPKSLLNEAEQIQRALEAFQARNYLVFADDVQLQNLSDTLDLNSIKQVKLMRLVPLVGG